MGVDGVLLRLRRPAGAWAIGLGVAVAAVVVIVPAVDPADLTRAAGSLAAEPGVGALVLLAYLGAFAMRALAWHRVLPDLSFWHALAGIHLALGGNHVLPMRLGEALRVTSVVRRAGVDLRVAAASSLTLRAADVVALTVLAGAAGPTVIKAVTGTWVLAAALPLAAGVLLVLGLVWSRRLLRAGSGALRLPGAGVALLVLSAWLLEAVVLWAAARWVGVDLSPSMAVLVTTVTIGAQTVALAPGGFGTYEAAGTAALAALGVEPATGLAIALTAHALKTAYSLAAGGVALVLPAPPMAGSGEGRLRTSPLRRTRLRLPRRRPARPAPVAVPSEAPVVLFLPAHDEEATIAAVIRRAPAFVHGRRVEVVVVDDGSSDGTAAAAIEAGARVIRHRGNHGLGAAVATGLADAVAGGAAAVAFCDADGEYAPEELGAVIAPVLDGRADYVVGSRFSGDIQRMLPHRRLGNLVLTAALRVVAREPISDGQSGYRALSPAAAAAAAQLAHDYNYAQVLTLDLLAKGFGYCEVPISYRFRETGRSFVRLGRYLRHVVPAVLCTVNAARPTIEPVEPVEPVEVIGRV